MGCVPPWLSWAPILQLLKLVILLVLLIVVCTCALKHTILNQKKQNTQQGCTIVFVLLQRWKLSLHCICFALLYLLSKEQAADELQPLILWAELKLASLNEQPFDSSKHITACPLFSLTLCQAYYTCLSSQGNRRITISIWLLLLLRLIFTRSEIQQLLSFCFIFSPFSFSVRKTKQQQCC